METLQAIGLDSLSAITLPSVAIAVCRLAGRLLEQLACEDRDIIDDRYIPPDFDVTIAQGLATTPQPQSTVTNCISYVVRSLRQQVGVCQTTSGQSISKLRFVNIDNTHLVEWVARDGNVVQKEPFEHFVGFILESGTRELDAYQGRFQELEHKYHEIGGQVLSDVSPKLADAVQLACQRNKCVGIHLCRTSDRRGVPLGIWVYLDPRPNPRAQGSCTLSVYRAHRDFILGAADGSQFFFPPCLIAARLVCANGCFQVMHPTICEPRGGYHWNHPYTGPLHDDLFAGAILDHEETELLYEPHEDALKLFPQLALRMDAALERDLCLGGQPQVIAKLQQRLQSGIQERGTLDVLSIVKSLHEVARMGLTRGHQNNISGPRVPLAPGNMPYPLQGRPVHGALAKRIFVDNTVSYHGSQTSSSRRR